jgi:hypothetical protein
MKILTAILFTATIFLSQLHAQVTEIECSVYRRAGAYLTLTPAHYDAALLPQINEQITLLIYAKDNLPMNKVVGYYELFKVQVIKLIPESKSITIKAMEDFETARTRIGLPNLSLNSESMVKISWLTQ